jgi:hypothetical protein
MSSSRPSINEIRILQPADRRTDRVGTLVIEPTAVGDGSGLLQADVTLQYASAAAVDQFLSPPNTRATQVAEQLDCIPGFRVTRLPLDEQIMPTALAWTPDGTLVVASLKGRVWFAKDADGDGLEDKIWPYSDELAAPYGLATGAGYVDVLNKSALLRLCDNDADGRADRTETIASGWGHTDDYHDWAVGLPRDQKGHYYVALPCQQDERDPAAAYLRGRILRLIPQPPSPHEPRRFRIESWAAGQRFPMGLALSRQGQLLATDNQGNYNPFNELNHIERGRNYGFINRLERGVGDPPPLTPPAVNIPHPWTRSVNGICFLEAPDTQEKPGTPPFGPFAGHLVGCEYDTRRLIRMSLQAVDGRLQGAAYPLSLESVAEGEAMLGPICCAVSPGGRLYVGSVRDSGWGAANNVGEVLQIEMDSEQLPCGIRTVTATPTGFRLDFTRPVDIDRAASRQRYAIASYFRISTPAYGGDDQQRRQVAVKQVRVAPDALSVELDVEPLVAERVYEIRLQPLIADGDFFPAEAFYTLNRLAPRSP